MRGRTNIVQRVGPSVIGQLVTQKQVTGSKIEVGDFVEFTGNTSAEQTIFENLNYQYYSKFQISSTVFGVALYNPTSGIVRIVIYDKNGVITDKNFSNIYLNLVCTSDYSMYKWSGSVFNSFYDNGKIYITSGELNDDGYYSSDTNNYINDLQSGNFIVSFSVSSSHNVTLDGYISLSILYDFLNNATISEFTGDYSNVIAPIIKNGNIYIFVGKKNSANNTSNIYLFYFNIDEENENNILYQSFGYFWLLSRNLNPSGSTSAYYYSNQFSFKLFGDEIIVGYGQTIKIFNIYDFSYNSYESEYIFANIGFDICKIGNLYFINGSAIYREPYGATYNNGTYAGLSVFYIDNGNVNVVAYDRSNYSNSFYRYRCGIFVKQKNNNYYYVIHTMSKDSYSNNIFLSMLDYEQNSFEGTNSVALGAYRISWIFDDNAIVVSRVLYDSITLKNKIFSISNDDKIEQIEGYDLVKKYENRIDGVAKTEGSAGQLISVYIP